MFASMTNWFYRLFSLTLVFKKLCATPRLLCESLCYLTQKRTQFLTVFLYFSINGNNSFCMFCGLISPTIL